MNFDWIVREVDVPSTQQWSNPIDVTFVALDGILFQLVVTQSKISI
jgi:hypothetical protein